MKRLSLPQRSATNWLDYLSQSHYAQGKLDSYSEGELIRQLENQIADILGKPAALFFSKGMTAQFCMLKEVEYRTKNQQFILSPYSHLAVDEEQSYIHLLGLKANFPSYEPRPYVLKDLTKGHQSAASMLIELPLRRAGFRLPTWQDLEALSGWANSHSVHCHMDGARIWESRYFYQRSEAKIASLFDSVYVSLYKGLGGMGGAVLAGETEFIEACKVWRSRFAGNHYTLFPYLISALEGYDRNYSKMEELVQRAQEIAAALTKLQGINIPEVHTNGFFVFLEESVQDSTDTLNNHIKILEDELQIQITSGVTNLIYSEQRILEIQVGTDHAAISTHEIVNFFQRLLETTAN